MEESDLKKQGKTNHSVVLYCSWFLLTSLSKMLTHFLLTMSLTQNRHTRGYVPSLWPSLPSPCFTGKSTDALKASDAVTAESGPGLDSGDGPRLRWQ